MAISAFGGMSSVQCIVQASMLPSQQLGLHSFRRLQEDTWETGPTPVGPWADRHESSTCAQGWKAARPLWTQHCSCRYVRQFGKGDVLCPAWGPELLMHRSRFVAGRCKSMLIAQSGQQHQTGDSRRSLERLFRVPAAGVSSSGVCSSAAAAAAAAAGLGMGFGRGASMGGSEGFSRSVGPADSPLACRMDALKSRTPMEQHHRPLRQMQRVKYFIQARPTV